MEIYSHRGIDVEAINTMNQYKNDYDEVAEFSVAYDKALVVNMPYVGTCKNNANKQGWLRDLNYYFVELLSRNPEYFSKRNVELIKKRRSPFCDKIFIEHFPEYEHCIGNKLIHHHIGKDGQVVALPSDIHIGKGGVHIIEEKIGIDINAIEFSNRVSDSVDNGKEFKWEEVEQYISEPINSSVNNTQNDSKQHINKNGRKGNNTDNINEYNQTSEETRSNINIKVPSSFKETNGAKGFWTKGIDVASSVVKSTAGKVIIGGLVVGVVSQTPIGKRVIKETSNKLLKNNIGKGTAKELVKLGSRETTKEVAKKTTKEVAKVVGKEVVKGEIGKSIVGIAKSPHIRKEHMRKLASGVIIPVKEAIIHKELLL